MTREEFKTHVIETIEDIIKHAELKIGHSLPRRCCFNLAGRTTPPIPENDLVDFITDQVYIDSDHIYPCFDIGVNDLLDDGRILLIGSRAGFAPGPWQKNWTGREGPFVRAIGSKLIAKFNAA